jgi:hypothetical protein
MKSIIRVYLCLTVLAVAVYAQPAALTITTEPNAIVWIDEIRRGATDASGKLTLAKLSPGRHTVRIRANSFKEATATLLPGRRTLVVKLVGTTDPAILMFQQAEKAREEARDDASRESAADLYREALKNPPPNAAAHVGLARLMLDLNKFKDAPMRKHQQSKGVSIAKRASRTTRSLRFAAQFVKRTAFSPKPTSASRECTKTRATSRWRLSSCAKRWTNFPTANP